MANSLGKTLAVLLFLIFAAGIVWSEENLATSSDAFQRMSKSADDYFSSGIKDITADQLWEELHDADTTQPYVISVRSLVDDTLRGHIAGSHHWDPISLIHHRDQLPKDKKIVIYCYTGQSSSLCTAFLNFIGYNAYNLRWGLCAWTADSSKIGMGGGWYKPNIGHQRLETIPHPMTAEYTAPTPKAPSTEIVDLFCANVEPQISKPTSQWKLKSATDVYSNIEDSDSTNNWFVVFYGPETVYNLGHIPGAYHIEPGEAITENLKHLPPDRPIVVYCMNGHMSLQASTLLNALGYDAYSLKRGLNTITDSDEILGKAKWVPCVQSYPLVTGPLPVH